LTAAELDAYDHVPRDMARRVRIMRIPLIPGGYVGITLGAWIFVTESVPADGSSSLIAHELVHVRQWSELGKIRFGRRYTMSFLRGLRVERAWKAAYWVVEAEQEARAETNSWVRRRSAVDGHRAPAEGAAAVMAEGDGGPR